MTQVITAKTTSRESVPNWLGSIPTHKLSSLYRERRKKYVEEILKMDETTSGLKTKKDTAVIIVQLLLQHWHVFY